MNGSEARAVPPSVTLLVGIVRQPRTGWPSSAAMSAKIFSHSARCAGVLRQEDHADAVLAGARQGHAPFARHQLQEFVRRLDEDARAVAGIGLAAARAAMVQVQQHLQGLLDDGVGLPAFDVGHESHPAGLVLELRIVQALLGRRSSPLPPAACACSVSIARHVAENRVSTFA